MKVSSLMCIRRIEGFTSAREYEERLLTSSKDGVIALWDIETGNPIKRDVTHGSLRFVQRFTKDRFVLQTDEYISLYDFDNSHAYEKYDNRTTSFARVSVQDAPDPLVLVPSDENIIKFLDFRTSRGGLVGSITPFELDHSVKNGLGILHNCRFYSIEGNTSIISTYESATIALYDLRNTCTPLMVHTMDTLESIPGLAVWNRVILTGDTKGNIAMFYISSHELQLLKTENISTGISFMDITHDGALLALGCWDRSIRLVETRNLRIKHVLQSHSSNIIDVAFNDNCKHLITTSNDGNSFIWDINYP